ncbi:MAG: transcription termination factor NusA [Deltaproteobacteria bacterium]|jgi:N utilization substance protein A|nr:transcription termination factor NusA [Deltaproteobacteria bacterium]
MSNNQELKRIIDQICRDKGIDRSVLILTLEEAIRSAAKRKYGLSDNFEVAFNEETGEIDVFHFKEVVAEVTEPSTQISLAEAKKLDPESDLGEELGVKLEAANFGRIAAQSAKQVIIQRMKDAERDLIFEEFQHRVGEIVNGIIQRVDKGNIILNLGRAEALLPTSEQIPREAYYHRGERLRALIIDAKLVSRGPQILLSRTHPDFLSALFEAEVPEISEGIVKIVSVAREPGSRAKISVTSTDSDIDPVGACVGLRGSRVQGVVQELKGEKIDIIPYSPDIAHYVASALAPAGVIRVVVDEQARSLEVVVPDEQLSLAIGRKGQNVRLASRLVGWRIDVKNESKYQRALKDGYQSLLRLPGVGEFTADLLFEAGYGSARDLLEVDPEQLAMIEGVTLIKARQVWDAAKEYVENLDREDAAEAAAAAMAKDFFAPKSPAQKASEAARAKEEAEREELEAAKAREEADQEEAIKEEAIQEEAGLEELEDSEAEEEAGQADAEPEDAQEAEEEEPKASIERKIASNGAFETISGQGSLFESLDGQGEIGDIPDLLNEPGSPDAASSDEEGEDGASGQSLKAGGVSPETFEPEGAGGAPEESA